MKTPKTGALALYKTKLALVSDIAGEKFTLRIAGGDSKVVRRKDFTLLFPGPVTALPAAPAEALPPENQAEIAELMDGEAMDFAEFTELAFGKFTAATAWAAQLLIAEDCQFHGDTEGTVEANSAGHVAALRAKAAAKNAAHEAREALLSRIKNGAILPEDSTSLREIENVAYGESESSKLLHDLGMEALPGKAQALLLKLGAWNYFANNPWPRRAGIALDPDYPEWPAELPVEEREDLTALTAYAIDDADSTDPDDAIAFDAATGLVWVHVADPGAIATYGSALEEFAADTGESLYIPEKIVPMFPPEAVPMLGLGLHETNPALSFGIRISPEGEAHLEKLCISFVKVIRLDYEGAAPLLEAEPLRSLAAELERFRARREAENAVMIRLPEVKIKTDLETQEIRITPLPQNAVREMVANAMLAAGAAAARFAVEHDFPLPFAIQPEPEMTERPDTLTGMYQLRKSCRQSELSTIPGRHAGLGLEPYARVTSPLRRYEDLLSHLQLRRYLKGETLFRASELDERIYRAAPAASARGKLEKSCNEYWTLVYLVTHPEWEAEAIFIAKPDERSVWLIPELAFEFKNRYGGRTKPGESVRIKCIGADPALITSQFRVLPKTASAGEAEAAEELTAEVTPEADN